MFVSVWLKKHSNNYGKHRAYYLTSVIVKAVIARKLVIKCKQWVRIASLPTVHKKMNTLYWGNYDARLEAYKIRVTCCYWILEADIVPFIILIQFSKS